MPGMKTLLYQEKCPKGELIEWGSTALLSSADLALFLLHTIVHPQESPSPPPQLVVLPGPRRGAWGEGRGGVYIHFCEYRHVFNDELLQSDSLRPLANVTERFYLTAHWSGCRLQTWPSLRKVLHSAGRPCASRFHSVFQPIPIQPRLHQNLRHTDVMLISADGQ